MKKAIITAIFGNYDTLKTPSVMTKGWDYICLTDRNLVSDKWQVVSAPARFNDPSKNARYYKIMPLLDRDIIIWVDGSIQINCDLDNFVSKYYKDDITIMDHPHRGCVYEEAQACIDREKDDPDIIKKQIEKYRKENYPENNGMIASGIFIRNNKQRVKELLYDWSEQVTNYSKRDQISFNYVAEKHPEVRINLIPFSILENSLFNLNPHVRKDM